MITCTFEKGNNAALRHVVVEALIIKDNKILLEKRAPELLCGGKYAIVGGYMERDENLEEALARETLEETGYIIKILSLLRVKDRPDRPQEDRQNISFVYITEPIEKIQDADAESTEVTWFPLNALPPENQFAFDHYEDILLYKRSLRK